MGLQSRTWLSGWTTTKSKNQIQHGVRFHSSLLKPYCWAPTRRNKADRHREVRWCRQWIWKDSSVWESCSGPCEGPPSLGSWTAPESLVANPPCLLLMTWRVLIQTARNWQNRETGATPYLQVTIKWLLKPCPSLAAGGFILLQWKLQILTPPQSLNVLERAS